METLATSFLAKLQDLNIGRIFLSNDEYKAATIDGDALYIACIASCGDSIYIKSLKEFDVSSISNVKPLYIQGDSKAGNSYGASCCIPSLMTFTKRFDIELMQRKEINAAFAFQIEPLLPYPLDSCVVDKLIVGTSDHGSTILAFSALKDDIKQQISNLTPFCGEIECLFPKAVALAQFSRTLLGKESRILIDLGFSETTIVLVEEGNLIGTRSLSLSLHSKSELEDTNGEHCKLFANELLRALLSFQPLCQNALQLPVTFTGPVESDPLILTTLGKLLHVAVHQPNTFMPGVILTKGITVENCTSYASSIGAALLQTKAANPDLVLDFRKGDLSYENKWNRWKKELVIYFCMTLLLSGIFFAFSHNYLQKRQETLYANFRTLELLLEKSPSDRQISLSSLSDELYRIQEEIQKPSDDIVLYPDIPRVSDVLAFLSSHPKVVFLDNKEGIQLDGFSYILVKRPEKGKAKEKYQVRVDLEFIAPNATIAREFHEALLAPNAFVDPKNEVKWSMQKGRYTTSFFLKDKTHYPSLGDS